MRKNLLFLLRSDPARSSHLAEAIDAALVAGVFDQAVSVLFKDDGVRALIKREPTDGETDGQLARTLTELADYGVESRYVCSESLARLERTVADLGIEVEVLSLAEQQALIARQDAVIND